MKKRNRKWEGFNLEGKAILVSLRLAEIKVENASREFVDSQSAIAERLRKRLDKSGKSLRWVARRMGVSAPYVHDVINANRTIHEWFVESFLEMTANPTL